MRSCRSIVAHRLAPRTIVRVDSMDISRQSCCHKMTSGCPVSCACRSPDFSLFEEIAFCRRSAGDLAPHSGAKNVCPQTVPDPGPTLVPEVVPDPVPMLGRPGPRRVNEGVCCMLFARQPFRGSPGCLGGASSPWLVSYVAGAVNQLFAEAHTDFSCRHWSDGPRPRCYETSQGGLATRRPPHR